MRNVFQAFAGLFLVLSAQLASATATLEGKVVGVTDGDTVKVLLANRSQVVVRLAFIDAPETSCHAWASEASDLKCVDKGQPFGKAAKKRLSGLVFDKQVKVVTTGELAQGRTVGTLWVRDIDANLEMVKSGHACHYVAYAKRGQTREQFQVYAKAEQSARSLKAGQWSDKRSVCGWEHRTNKRKP